MQAAAALLLLVAGACGASPCQSAGEQNAALWSPVTPDGVVTYRTGIFGCPLYSPLWLVHSNQKFYPANYAKPYDYREAFGYPWNGPHPAPLGPSGPPIAPPEPAEQLPEPSPAAAARRPSGSTGAWPSATAANYVRQSQSRVASKPVVESR